MFTKPILNRLFTALFTLILFANCAVIRPGEVGVKQKLGKLDDKINQPGTVLINPITTNVVKVPTRTMNMEVGLSLPSKEGLNVNSEISILYRIEPSEARNIIQEVGVDYENVLIMSVFRSAAADVSAQYFAKDMHSGNRRIIEDQIEERMETLLETRGFEIEAVLMKSINLPMGLYRAIEDKLEAEQDAQRMEFVLQKERQEAERKKIEAAGVRDAQQILAAGLSYPVIQWRSLEVLRELSQSPNAKLILTDGKTPVLINPDMDKDDSN